MMFRRRSIGGVALLLATLVLAASLPRPAYALSCSRLAYNMFNSPTQAVYWAKRYYRAGCGS